MSHALGEVFVVLRQMVQALYVDLIEVSKTFEGERESAVGPITLHIPSGQCPRSRA